MEIMSWKDFYKTNPQAQEDLRRLSAKVFAGKYNIKLSKVYDKRHNEGILGTTYQTPKAIDNVVGAGKKAWITRKLNNPEKYGVITPKKVVKESVVVDSKDLNIVVNGHKVIIQAKLLSHVLISEKSITINF